MSEFRFFKFFQSLGKRYWDLVSDEKIAEQFLISEQSRIDRSPKFFNYCDRRINLHKLICQNKIEKRVNA